MPFTDIEALKRRNLKKIFSASSQEAADERLAAPSDDLKTEG
jgi:hypothetical protein